jgi:D-alanyl-D-alanine carboxypeptidase
MLLAARYSFSGTSNNQEDAMHFLNIRSPQRIASIIAVASVFSVLGQYGIAHAQKAVTADSPQSRDAATTNAAISAKIDAAIAPHIMVDEPGGAIIVVRDGKVIYRRAYGLADIAKKTAIKTDDVFRIGSVTKQFTAVAILMLAEQGKLRLSDDITMHLPDYPPPAKKITIEHLLTHTSGIPSYTDSPSYATQMDKDLTTQQMIDQFKALPLQFDPGTDWRYNNSGYFLLGVIIEKVSGMSYADFLAKNIFIPLDMRDTAYEGNERSGKKRIEGYTRRDDRTIIDRPVSMTQPYAAGSLISTVDDLSKWNAAVTAGELLKAETWKKAFTDATLTNGNKTGYGYGWQIRQLRGVPAIAHGGGINGFASFAISVPSKNTFVAVLSNTTAGQGIHTYIAEKVAAMAIDNPHPDFNAVKLDDTQLDKHVGVYRVNDRVNRSVTREGNQLFVQRTDGRKLALTPSSPTAFFVKNTFTHLKFEQDVAGETTVMVMSQSGGEDRSPRISKTVQTTPTEIKLSEAMFAPYIGQYELAPNFVLTIWREGDRFYSQATGQGRAEIFAEAENRFFLKVVNAKLQFEKDASGNVTKLTLFQNGREIPGKKIR